MKKETIEFKHCNHHHELTSDQELVDLGTGEFVADKERIPLLKALNECGLETRTHCYGHKTGVSFVAIKLKNVDIEIRRSHGYKELLLTWDRID